MLRNQVTLPTPLRFTYQEVETDVVECVTSKLVIAHDDLNPRINVIQETDLIHIENNSSINVDNLVRSSTHLSR